VSSLGGPIVGVRVAIPFVDGNFNTYILEKAGTQYLQSNQNGGNITAPAPINYGSGVLICIWRWDGTGAPATLRMTVNGAPVALSSTTPTTPDNPTDGINIGGNANLFLDSRDIILAEDVGYNASSDELEAQLYAYLASIYLA